MAVRSEDADTDAHPSSSQHPMAVKVTLMGELQRSVGKRQVKVELPEGARVQMLAQELSKLCGAAFARHALTKEGAFQPHVAVFINGVQIEKLDGAQTVLTGGEVELMLLPMYEGG
ncbi:MAG: MoaD/ThiS family protein [Candidatus Binatia bacterium]